MFLRRPIFDDYPGQRLNERSCRVLQSCRRSHTRPSCPGRRRRRTGSRGFSRLGTGTDSLSQSTKICPRLGIDFSVSVLSLPNKLGVVALVICRLGRTVCPSLLKFTSDVTGNTKLIPGINLDLKKTIPEPKINT